MHARQRVVHLPRLSTQYVSDLRVSVRETLIRSLSDLRFKLHRKYPKTESLKDCMSRTIPFFTDTIVPQSIAKGKTVLVASSENAIRGLLMHLCDIPSDRIAEVEIPTGLPLIYNVNKRCIQLLETGEEDPSDPIGHLGACVPFVSVYRSWGRVMVNTLTLTWPSQLTTHTPLQTSAPPRSCSSSPAT